MFCELKSTPLGAYTVANNQNIDLIPGWLLRMSEVFHAAISTWEKSNISDIPKLLRGYRKKYDMGKDALINHVKGELQKFLDDLDMTKIATSPATADLESTPELWRAEPGCPDLVSSDVKTEKDDATTAANMSTAEKGRELADLEAAMARLLESCDVD
jgi:hypothetical protein